MALAYDKRHLYLLEFSSGAIVSDAFWTKTDKILRPRIVVLSGCENVV